jgi:hypothetical protein
MTVNVEPLHFLAPLERYQEQASQLLAAHHAADPTALRVIHDHHPRFLDEVIPWLPRPLTPEDIAATPFDIADARMTVARAYTFLDWDALAGHVDAVTRLDSPVRAFERAVHSVITGDVGALRASLDSNPELVRARSVRRTCQNPSVHGATLLHYLAANGVEGHNQRSPANAVEVASVLLEGGADPNALAGMYGGQYATLSMLVSSSPPADAGVQVPLIDVLVDAGASVEPLGSELWGSPLLTALRFGFLAAAEALVRHGARVDGLAAAAGLGRTADAARLLPDADSNQRHAALALAAQLGHADVVQLLLDAGVDPDRYNPSGHHDHSTALHQAALAGHDEVVRLLVERGARLDIEDSIYHATPLGWAEYSGREATAAYLRSVSGQS